jgi:hypothetical protein
MMGLGTPTVADRASALATYERTQNRMRAAMTSLLENAPEARARNPGLYEGLIVMTNQFLGGTNAYFEEVLHQTAEAPELGAALAAYVAQVESYVAAVESLTGAVTPNNPAPTMDVLQTTGHGITNTTAPMPPIAPLPGMSGLGAVPEEKRTWVFYALTASGVLAGLGVLGAVFLRSRRRNKRAR